MCRAFGFVKKNPSPARALLSKCPIFAYVVSDNLLALSAAGQTNTVKSTLFSAAGYSTLNKGYYAYDPVELPGNVYVVKGDKTQQIPLRCTPYVATKENEK